MAKPFVELPGSHRPAKSTARRLGDIDQNLPLELTIALRGEPLPDADSLAIEPMSREAVTAAYSASEADAEKVAEVLQGFGFKILEISLSTRSMRVEGTVANAEAAFKPGLALYRSADQGDYRGRDGSVCVPAALDGLVTGVFGLDERRTARRKSVADRPQEGGIRATGVYATGGGTAPSQPVTPSDLERLYNFPPGDAAGTQIIIAEFGGGYFAEDLAAYCQKMGRPLPKVVPKGFGRPAYTRQDILAMPPDQRSEELGNTIEVMMDIQIVAGLCPAADIFIYFAPFTQKGWVDLLDAVLKGAPAATPVAVSVSWGGAEDDPQILSAAAVQAIDEKLNAIARLGITVCVCSGDDGSGDQVSDGAAHADFPASSVYSLGVGGTAFSNQGQEVVWWDKPGRRTGKGGGSGGGGVSTVFQRPAWQAVHIPSLNAGSIDGRVVPDIAALAGEPLYDLIFLGQDAPNGGTSASAPTWASMVARVSAGLPVGKQRRYLTRLLYAPTASGAPVGAVACRPITSGNNASFPMPGRGYVAVAGFSAVAGWGVPDGQKLQHELAQM